jgi:hypothetical protein
MSKNAAKEGVLGGLHELVAQVLAAKVGHTVKVPVFTPEGEIELDENDQPVRVEVYDASPQLLATAIKFLKDNEITATAEQSVEVANLEDEVAKKRAANQLRKDEMKKRREEAMKKLDTQ